VAADAVPVTENNRIDATVRIDDLRKNMKILYNKILVKVNV
jgi:hypothetical protein